MLITINFSKRKQTAIKRPLTLTNYATYAASEKTDKQMSFYDASVNYPTVTSTSVPRTTIFNRWWPRSDRFKKFEFPASFFASEKFRTVGVLSKLGSNATDTWPIHSFVRSFEDRVTRLGEILPLWPSIKKSWEFSKIYLVFYNLLDLSLLNNSLSIYYINKKVFFYKINLESIFWAYFNSLFLVSNFITY